MPELAEVEFYRRVWDCGLGETIRGVRLHPDKRIFRGTNPAILEKALPGGVLLKSEAHGKQMLFQFSNGNWLGLHLGMTGELRVEKPAFQPGKHDHLVLELGKRTLVFSDPRQFGRVRFHSGSAPPDWWSTLPAPLVSPQFSSARMKDFLEKHRKLPLKAALLLQSGFPGVGNWMADEILWRAGLEPRVPAGQLSGAELQKLWRTIRLVCRQAIKNVGRSFSDLPAGWLFHERWERTGQCPRHRQPLLRETVGGRTTVWCQQCQPARRRASSVLA